MLLKLSVVIFVSPLVSLMVDQVSSLHSRGISAAILSENSGVDKKYITNEGDIKTGQYRFHYSCPGGIVAGQRWKQFLLETPFNSCEFVLFLCSIYTGK